MYCRDSQARKLTIVSAPETYAASNGAQLTPPPRRKCINAIPPVASVIIVTSTANTTCDLIARPSAPTEASQSRYSPGHREPSYKSQCFQGPRDSEPAESPECPHPSSAAQLRPCA